MVLSKGKKIILIAAIVIIALIAGFLSISRIRMPKSKRETQ